jgi:putative membrane protein
LLKGGWNPRIHLFKESKMKKAVLAFALLAFAAPSHAQSVGEKTGFNSALGIAPKTEDFIKEVAISDMTEIEAAKIAQQKGNDDEKKFAEMMVADHTKTSTELKSMVPDNMKAAIPTVLDDASQKKIAKLRDAKPEDFAADYDPVQVSAHKDAVSLFERYANGGDDPKLKDWAGRTLPALQHHLEMAQALDKNRK